MLSRIGRRGSGMMITANGPVFPGRNNTTAKQIFFSGKGGDLEMSPAVLCG